MHCLCSELLEIGLGNYEIFNFFFRPNEHNNNCFDRKPSAGVQFSCISKRFKEH